jgi:biopolymer transport protein TolR
MITKKNKRIMTEINITPFTDVVLVLLIIFVVAAPIIYKDDINVNLPKSTTGKKSQNLPNNVSITINKGDDVYFGDSRFNLSTDMDKIQTKLSSIVSTNKDSVITVNGDKDCRYDSVVKLIGILDKAGLKKIVLGVELVR